MEFLEFFKIILENPFIAAFVFLYGLGWLLKHHTPLNNDLIPWVLAILGIVIGYLLLENTLKGAIAGFAMGLFTVGAYQFIKSTSRVARSSRIK